MELNCKSVNEFNLLLDVPAWISLEFIISILFPTLVVGNILYSLLKELMEFTTLFASINSEKNQIIVRYKTPHTILLKHMLREGISLFYGIVQY